MDILIVDHSRVFHEIVQQLFSGRDLQPVFAETGAEAMKQLAAREFAFICSAQHLADMSGIELCRQVRNQALTRYAPFILFTADKPLDMQQQAYAVGVTDIFNKLDLDQLVVFIQRLLAQHSPIQGRVLVVEDSESQAAFYREVLQSYGIEVVLTDDAEKAVALFEQQHFDLVITDIVLGSGMSGIALCNQIRRMSGLRGEVPILATTAFDDITRRIELFYLGINDYIIKPVAAEELMARTRNLLAHFRIVQQVHEAQRQAETDREVAYQELAYQATHDALTRLYNRWYFEQTLEDVVARNEALDRHAMALIDIASLRVVNDACGHEAGDALLKEIGARVATCLPEGAIAARLEGGRLGVFLRDCAQPLSTGVFDRVVQAIEQEPFTWQGRTFPLETCSGALASFTGIRSAAEAVHRAEIANTAAHASGAIEVLLYSESDVRIALLQKEKESLPEVLSALEGGNFALMIQRIKPLQSGISHGFEFLCRMVDKAGKLMAPGEFLPAAERYGLMPRLDRWVTHCALQWIAAYQHKGAGPCFFTINLSGQTMSDRTFDVFVREAVAETGVSPADIYFEITETAVIADPEAARRLINALSTLGFRFVLDDFGSGTASFGQLKNFPVAMLKIDGQFVRGMGADPLDLAIVHSTCEVARALNLLTVAEFVEDEATLNKLKDMGVNYAQGYAIHKPSLAAAEV